MSIQSAIHDYLAKFEADELSKPARCGACNKACALRWHGQYKRSVIARTQTYLVPIKRLFCSACRHTFALLPSFLVKFHRYAKETIFHLLKRLKRHTYDAVANWFTEQNGHCIAPLTLYFWRRKFA